jgi:hypothetical protein
MLCLADFVLDSDLCLAPDAGPLVLRGPGGAFSLTLSNADISAEPTTAVLSAQLTFDANAFDRGLRDAAHTKLFDILNYLAFTTSRKFSIVRLKRLIDWTPGLVERDAIIYHDTPEWDLAEPALDQKFLDTAERLFAMNSGADQNTAMRWYRLGLQAGVLEEQFSYFWFALEIAAEAMKGKDKVPSKCPRCQAKLFCQTCNEYPLHRRYAGEAIQQVVETVHPDNAEQIFKTLQLIRHTLMHGGRISSVQDQLPCTDQEALNKLAFVTWQAISRMFGKPDPRPEEPLNFGYCDNLVRRTVSFGVHIKTTLVRGDPNNPRLADFPHVQIDEISPPRPTVAPEDAQGHKTSAESQNRPDENG